MFETDAKLLGDILDNVSTKKYSESIESFADARCSAKHYRKMEFILGIDIEIPYPQRTWKIRTQIIAIIVAIMIVLTGCAAATIIVNEDIRDAVIEFFDKYIIIGFSKEESPNISSIQEIYEFNYIPSGYEKTQDLATPILVSYKWENEQGDYIIFRQETIDGSKHVIDNDSGELTKIQIGEIVVECHKAEHSCQYIWNDGKYSLMLTASQPLEIEELECIIKNIKK